MTSSVALVGREIIQKHFPNAKPDLIERHAIWLSPPTVTRVGPMSFVKEGEEIDAAIETFHRSIRDAWRAYGSIPLQVRRENGVDWVAFARLVRSVTGQPVTRGQDTSQDHAVAVMRKNLMKTRRISAQAAKADHPAKTALVYHCRLAWRDLAKRNAPVKPSEGSPFLSFVADVIQGSGNIWSAEVAIRAWRTSMGE